LLANVWQPEPATGGDHAVQLLAPATGRWQFHQVRATSNQQLNLMTKPTITAWLKTYCGWSNGVRAVLAKYDLPYEEKDIIKNPAFRWEMEQKSGQPLSPCVEVNGVMLADISGEEVEQYLLQNDLVGTTEKTTDVPLNRSCSDAEHEAMAQGVPLKFQP